MKLTTDQLDELAIYSTDRLRMAFFPEFVRCFEKYRINTPIRMAMFLSQFIHETASFSHMTEMASGSAYEHRKDLGNTSPEAIAIAARHGSTPGVWFKGRGGFQCTGYANFYRIGKLMGLDLVNNPKLLTTPANAVESSCVFWNDHNLSAHADIGNFNEVTRRINGGFNGKKQRDDIYALAKKVFKL